MTDQEHNRLCEFTSLPDDERRKYLKKMSREHLINLAVLCAAKADRERKDKEEYGAQYERTKRELQDLYDERSRHLEMSDKIADELNRLQNEVVKLKAKVAATLDARSKCVLVIEALTNAFHADIKLAELGEPSTLLPE